MDEPEYLKCACKECGNHLEYPSSAARTTITCPHCGQWTELAAPPEEPERVTVKLGWVVILGVVFLVIALVALGLRFGKHSGASSTATVPAPPAVKAIAPPPVLVPTQAVVPVPTQPRPKSLADLKVSEVKLEKAQGSLVYAVGTVKNNSDFQRFSVKIELELINLKGKTIGKTQDQKSVIEPRQEWTFHALIPETDAVAAKVISLTEGE